MHHQTRKKLLRTARKPMRTLEDNGVFSAESDGRTLWINMQGRCIARFSPVGREVQLRDGGTSSEGELPAFENFWAVMFEEHGIDVRPFQGALTWQPLPN